MMFNEIETRFHFEEWMLEADSAPGWELVPDFVKKLIKMKWTFHGWIFEVKRERMSFWRQLFKLRRANENEDLLVDIHKFDSENNVSFLGFLDEFLRKSAVCLIRANKNIPSAILLTNYVKTSEGLIYNNQASEVFPYRIEIGDWANVNDNEILIVIWHDGEPVFILTKH